HDRVRSPHLPARPHRVPGPLGLDPLDSDAAPDPLRPERRAQRVGQSAEPSSRPQEDRPGRPITRDPSRRPGATDQAPVISLPRLELGEGGAHAQRVDVGGEQPAEERGDQPFGRLVPQTAPQQRAQRSIGSGRRRAAQEVHGSAHLSPPRHARPPPELTEVGRDAEWTARERQEPAIGPDERGAARRRLQLRAESELATQLHARRLPREQGVGPRLDLDPRDIDRADLAARRPLGLEDDDVEVARHGVSATAPAREPVRRGKARNAATDDHDAPAHRSAASPTCSRTTAASMRTKAGSAFGISVLAKARPTSSATARAWMSRSYRISRWSATNPAEHTTTARWPSAGSSRMTSSTGGPHHGSAVRPALCQAIV